MIGAYPAIFQKAFGIDEHEVLSDFDSALIFGHEGEKILGEVIRIEIVMTRGDFSAVTTIRSITYLADAKGGALFMVCDPVLTASAEISKFVFFAGGPDNVWKMPEVIESEFSAFAVMRLT